jgi:hypothetical protein
MWYFADASHINRRHIEAQVQRTLLRWMVLDSMVMPFGSTSGAVWIRAEKPISFPMGVEWGVFFELSEGEFLRLVWFEGGYSRQTSEVAASGVG